MSIVRFRLVSSPCARVALPDDEAHPSRICNGIETPSVHGLETDVTRRKEEPDDRETKRSAAPSRGVKRADVKQMGVDRDPRHQRGKDP